MAYDIAEISDWIDLVRGGGEMALGHASEPCIIPEWLDGKSRPESVGGGTYTQGDPMPCNMAEINNVITLSNERIRELHEAAIREPGFFDDVAVAMRMSATNVVTLEGSDSNIAAVMRAAGKTSIQLDTVLLAVSGNTIKFSVPGQTDIFEIAEILALFIDTNNLVVSTTAAIDAKNAKRTNALTLLGDAHVKSRLIDTILGGTQEDTVVIAAPVVERFDLDNPSGFDVEATLEISGSPAPICEITWEDGVTEMVDLDQNGEAVVSHTYSTLGAKTVSVIARNGIDPPATREENITLS